MGKREFKHVGVYMRDVVNILQLFNHVEWMVSINVIADVKGCLTLLSTHRRNKLYMVVVAKL